MGRLDLACMVSGKVHLCSSDNVDGFSVLVIKYSKPASTASMEVPEDSGRKCGKL